MRTVEDALADRPANVERVEELIKQMIARTRGYHLRELREADGLTQLDLVRKLHMSLETIVRIEHGDVEQMRIETLQRYVEWLGGSLEISVQLGHTRYRLA